MKKLHLFIIAILTVILNFQAFSQYQIGHRQVTYTDPARSNRSIQTELYYPATTAGDNVPVATGQYPIIVFGHGFVMAWSAYQNFWDSIVPRGYIMAFPTTEGSMSPTHSEFGLDLAFLVNRLKTEGATSTSFLYQKVAATSAVAGHSMGGGASFLACRNNTVPTALINFAAANTTPSSITAAGKVSIPTLVFSGANDGVAPPAVHQKPMYDSCAAACKTFISITGGGHCYFANTNINCSAGEGFTSPQPTITREKEHAVVNYLLFPYLDYMLRGDQAAGAQFLNRLASSTDITYLRSCNTTNIPANEIADKSGFKIFPNPASGALHLNCTNIEFLNKPVNVSIINIAGQIIYTNTIMTGQYNSIDISAFARGIYTVKLDNNSFSTVLRVVIY